MGKVPLIGIFARVPETTSGGIHRIAHRRGERVQETITKALDQYIAADKRRK